MKVAFLCAALAAAAAPALATELVAYTGSDRIRLADTPCTSQAVLEHLDASVQPLFRAATAVLEGKTYSACWRITPTAAHLIYEDGDQGLVPFSILNETVSI